MFQAVNSIGAGHFSLPAQLRTRPLPPAPPRLECANANHNSLKLKWGGGGETAATSGPAAKLAAEAACQYTLEMANSRGQ